MYILFAAALLLYATLLFSAKQLWQQNPRVWKLALIQLPLRLIASTPSIPFLLTLVLPLGALFAYPVWLAVEIGKIYALRRWAKHG
ncbi:hypothetical protein LVJ83_13265 [Uruburuella testudinis]|uniref:Uncharacterized protein n=1 Tax=Uruburuella testudinis TaxID=1282863 RepID=A0ABY4DT29_9NEIS|nr:hypothetical protein [Uruburuella testudinis]UOO81854.1 hypothetical protein LVJ83_13265 [Uruburuella testudinis]